MYAINIHSKLRKKMHEIVETIITCVIITLMFAGGCCIGAYTASKQSGKTFKEELFDED